MWIISFFLVNSQVRFGILSTLSWVFLSLLPSSCNDLFVYFWQRKGPNPKEKERLHYYTLSGRDPLQSCNKACTNWDGRVLIYIKNKSYLTFTNLSSAGYHWLCNENVFFFLSCLSFLTWCRVLIKEKSQIA